MPHNDEFIGDISPIINKANLHAMQPNLEHQTLGEYFNGNIHARRIETLPLTNSQASQRQNNFPTKVMCTDDDLKLEEELRSKL